MTRSVGSALRLRERLRLVAVAAVVLLGASRAAADAPAAWKSEWPRTDFGKATVPLAEIRSVIGKDRIPAIDQPRFVSIAEAETLGLIATEPVISVAIEGRGRAYPLRILTWHEIVNDTLAGIPLAVTYCPLCNSALVFDRRVDGRILSFGTTGKLRNSDLVMYDRETESWWQQYLGEGLVGAFAGAKLRTLPLRVESFARFKQRHPGGEVLIPADQGARDYGRNPYSRYDSSAKPFLYEGPLPEGVPPLERVVVVDGEAWTLSLLKQRRRIVRDDLVITWEPGQNSALDTAVIGDGRDVGNVVVQRRAQDGTLADAVHDVSFAFAFRAFFPRGRIHRE